MAQSRESEELRVARWVYKRRSDKALVREGQLWAGMIRDLEDVPDDIVALYDELQARGLWWHTVPTRGERWS